MAINRSLMERQLRMGGGIMGLEPRQQYGLGSFVKKAVKGVKIWLFCQFPPYF